MGLTVRLAFGGRRDGRPVRRIGEVCHAGRFATVERAVEAAQSWLADATWLWLAEVATTDEATTPIVTMPPRWRLPPRKEPDRG